MGDQSGQVSGPGPENNVSLTKWYAMPFGIKCFGCWTYWDPCDTLFKSLDLLGSLRQTFHKLGHTGNLVTKCSGFWTYRDPCDKLFIIRPTWEPRVMGVCVSLGILDSRISEISLGRGSPFLYPFWCASLPSLTFSKWFTFQNIVQRIYRGSQCNVIENWK